MQATFFVGFFPWEFARAFGGFVLNGDMAGFAADLAKFFPIGRLVIIQFVVRNFIALNIRIDLLFGPVVQGIDLNNVPVAHFHQGDFLGTGLAMVVSGALAYWGSIRSFRRDDTDQKR